jgi:acetamidase/formamidase
MIHEIPLERGTLHGHFSRELAPILTVERGDTIAFACLDAGWHTRPDQPKFEPRDPQRDAGHALIGPIEVRGARKGQVLEIAIEAVRVGDFGFTVAGGWSTWLNDRLGVTDGERLLKWRLDADAGTASDDRGREVDLQPFLGVLGMPPDRRGLHDTGPPRPSGGNIDCKELVAGTTLFLPIPLDGALFSAGDGHGRQGDGESSGTAIECPIERAELRLDVRDDFELEWPIARTPSAWITFGFDVDVDDAAAIALRGMLDLMGREHGLDRHDALALASIVVDVHVTQLVNGVLGVHALLPHDAFRQTTMATS